MDSKHRLYDLAYDFLARQLSEAGASEPQSVISWHLKPSASHSFGPLTLESLYERALSSAQNSGMASKVIGQSVAGGLGAFGPLLGGFSPQYVMETYFGREDNLWHDILERLKPSGQIRTDKRSLWPRYCRSITTGARFFSDFSGGQQFINWASTFVSDPKSSAALPLILAQEIHGLGFTLACDFVKEIGFTGYAKPDTHITNFLKDTDLVAANASPYEVLKELIRIADAEGVTPFELDKLIFLIGSGNASKDGAGPKFAPSRDAFVRHYISLGH